MIIPPKIHGNMLFSAYPVRMVFLFLINMILPFCKKRKDDLLKNTHKDGIFCIIEKDDTHPEKFGISSDQKFKDDKRFHSVKHV